MCVICIKSAGVALPPIETFERCFKANPDGAGFAYPIRDLHDDTRFTAIQVYKGFSNFADFRTRYEQVLAELGSDTVRTPMVLHFRIGTHGSKAAPGQTHPFPVCDDYKIMEQLEGRYRTIMAHNGIYNLGDLAGNYSRYVMGDNPSDSEEFARNVLEPLTREPLWDSDKKVVNIIKHLNGSSRLLVMSVHDGGGLVLQAYGDFVTDTDGMIYSNRSFEPVKPVEPFDWREYHYNKEDFSCVNDAPTINKSTDFRNLRISMESWLASELTGALGGGYDRVLKEGMLTWYFPVVVTTTKPHGPRVVGVIDDPCDPWYTDSSQTYLYHLDTEKNTLNYVGRIESAVRIGTKAKIKKPQI